jgi:ABC-2 type transport system permease protein
MSTPVRYLRLYMALARFGLAREFAFRMNFLVKVSVEIIWLTILLAFYRIIFAKTSVVANWSEPEYLFFLGCYFALASLIESLFLVNCNQFSDLIRSGDLDFYLLKPIDEQFLVTFRDIDWGSVPSFLMGVGVMGMALSQIHWEVSVLQVVIFLGLFVCGMVTAYSLLLMLTSAAVWFTRNQSLYELWWLVTSLMRYPREIFSQSWWAAPIGTFFTYLVPILLVTNVPARVMVKALDLHPATVGFTLLVTSVLLVVSRRFFHFALRRYRSASS